MERWHAHPGRHPVRMENDASLTPAGLFLRPPPGVPIRIFSLTAGEGPPMVTERLDPGTGTGSKRRRVPLPAHRQDQPAP